MATSWHVPAPPPAPRKTRRGTLGVPRGSPPHPRPRWVPSGRSAAARGDDAAMPGPRTGETWRRRRRRLPPAPTAQGSAVAPQGGTWRHQAAVPVPRPRREPSRRRGLLAARRSTRRGAPRHYSYRCGYFWRRCRRREDSFPRGSAALRCAVTARRPRWVLPEVGAGRYGHNRKIRARFLRARQKNNHVGEILRTG